MSAQKRKGAGSGGLRPVHVLVLGGALVVVLAIVALFASSGGDDGDGESAGGSGVETASVSITGDPLPPLPDGGGADPAVGLAAPTASGSAVLGGGSLSVGDGPSVLVFVAHWCPHCQAEVPVITDWLDGADSVDGVAWRAVSTSVDRSAPNFPPSQWLDEEGWPVPTLADDDSGSVADAYGLSSFPYFVAIDADGDVVARATGEQPVEGLETLTRLAAGG